jgi:hypothetical protein
MAFRFKNRPLITTPGRQSASPYTWRQRTASSMPSSSRLSTTPAELLKDTIIYQPHRGYPLHITANRYYCRPRPGHNVEDDPDALTLICLHSTSFHKETWEPTLARLFQLAAEQVKGKNDRCVNIREAWAIEAPNHGTSGCLNQDALLLPEYHNNCK